MSTLLSKMVYERRKSEGITQDQFGARYGVSGPAIFKFEKGYVNPSFKLWMQMAQDFDIGEGLAVLLWARAKLPGRYQDIIELKGAKIKETEVIYKTGLKHIDYSRMMNRDKLRETVLGDDTLPKGLKALVKDNEVWQIYKPTGREINLLRESYERFGDGTKGRYREGLRVLREFSEKE